MVPQTDLVTANTQAQLWSLVKTNTALLQTDVRTETDALDIGKGDEFALTVYKTSISTGVAVEKFATSEFMAWLFAFGLGHETSTTTSGATTYVATPQDPAVECINLPPFTYLEQIRAEPNSVVDRAAVGMVVNDFTLTMEQGPGRANCRVAANFLGTGRLVVPSAMTMPTYATEHLLNASGATKLTINGIDYLLGTGVGRFNSLEFRWNNNVRTDSGYYPGSGMQNGFALRGRMEFGTREATLSFVARAVAGSPEYTNLLALTEGITEITVQGALISGTAYNSMDLLFPRTIISAAPAGDADGIVTIQCTLSILKPTDGVTPLCTFTVVTPMTGIGPTEMTTGPAGRPPEAPLPPAPGETPQPQAQPQSRRDLKKAA
jgi:hypothetical protein